MALKKNAAAAAAKPAEGAALTPAQKAAATKAAKAGAAPKAEAKPAKKTAPAKKAEPKPEVAESQAVAKPSVGKKQLAENVRKHVTSKGFGLPLKLAEAAVEGFEFAVVEALKAGNDVRLSLGKFSAVDVDARVARNPSTGEEVQVAAHVAPKFKPSATFKRSLNGEEGEAGEAEGDAEVGAEAEAE